MVIRDDYALWTASTDTRQTERETHGLSRGRPRLRAKIKGSPRTLSEDTVTDFRAGIESILSFGRFLSIARSDLIYRTNPTINLVQVTTYNPLALSSTRLGARLTLTVRTHAPWTHAQASTFPPTQTSKGPLSTLRSPTFNYDLERKELLHLDCHLRLLLVVERPGWVKRPWNRRLWRWLARGVAGRPEALWPSCPEPPGAP